METDKWRSSFTISRTSQVQTEDGPSLHKGVLKRHLGCTDRHRTHRQVAKLPYGSFVAVSPFLMQQASSSGATDGTNLVT